MNTVIYIRKSRTVALTALVIGFAVLGGATLSFGKTAKKEYSGVFAPYPEMEKGRNGALIYKGPEASLEGFKNVKVELIGFSFEDGTPGSYVRGSDLKMLEKYALEALEDELGAVFPLVDEVEEDTLVLRVVFTHLQPFDQSLFYQSQMVGRRVSRGAAADYVNGVGIGVGEAEIEAELVSGATNERIFLFIDREIGGRVKIDRFQGRDEWEHVRGIIYEWCNRLSDALHKANK